MARWSPSTCRCACWWSSPGPRTPAFIDPRAVSKPLLEALDALGDRVVTEFLYAPTLPALTDRLRDRNAPPVHVVHFDGHGVYDARLGLGYLLFEDDQNRADRVDANRLGTLLNRCGVPLMVLNACQSAAQEEANPYASVAARLIRAGVGSVLVMSYLVLVAAARRFVRAFYGGLARRDALDLAAAVLDDHGIDRAAIPRDDLVALMRHLGRHPLSLTLVLPHLRDHTPAELTARFEELLPGFTQGEAVERNESLAVSLAFSLRRLGEQTRAALPDLVVFQGGALESQLLEITGMDEDLWREARAELEQAALITAERVPGVEPPFLRFHPTLAPYLARRLEDERRAALEEARERHTEALETFRALGEPRMEGVAWHQFGRVAEERAEWDEAERCYRESLQIKERQNDLPGVARTCNQLAMVAKGAGRPVDAERWYLRAIELDEELGNPKEIAIDYSNLADLLLSQNRLDEAER